MQNRTNMYVSILSSYVRFLKEHATSEEDACKSCEEGKGRFKRGGRRSASDGAVRCVRSNVTVALLDIDIAIDKLKDATRVQTIVHVELAVRIVVEQQCLADVFLDGTFRPRKILPRINRG